MKSPVTESISALVPYQGGKPIEELARERGLSDIVKLASNESALGPSPAAVAAARAALAHVHRYPDGSGHRLRSAIAESHQVTLPEVIHGNGSNELIELIVRTFMTPEHHMIFGRPAFSMYPVVAAAHNVSSTAVPTDGNLVHQLSLMAQAVKSNTRVMIIDNPNNPTGTYVPQKAVEQLLRGVPEEVIVVMDEAYFEFADQPDYPNSLKLRHLRERLIVLRTFSKAYGLAGFRVGYGIGPGELIGFMNRLRAPFNVSVPSQEAARAALSDQTHLTQVISLNHRERGRVTAQLGQLASRVYPSQANFLLADFERPASEIYEALLAQGVIVRPIPGLERSLRVTLGTEAENDRFLAALREVLA